VRFDRNLGESKFVFDATLPLNADYRNSYAMAVSKRMLSRSGGRMIGEPRSGLVNAPSSKAPARRLKMRVCVRRKRKTSSGVGWNRRHLADVLISAFGKTRASFSGEGQQSTDD